MGDLTTYASKTSPMIKFRMREFINNWIEDRRRKKLDGLLAKLSRGSNLVSYAECELELMMGPDHDEMDRLGAEGVLRLIRLFSMEGHSGFSAPWAISVFKTLASFEPLGPLTGDDHEWIEVRTGMYQNRRCGRVFKDETGAYDIEGRVFRESNGVCYTSFESRVPVEFPYTPATVYVEAPVTAEGAEAA